MQVNRGCRIHFTNFLTIEGNTMAINEPKRLYNTIGDILDKERYLKPDPPSAFNPNCPVCGKHKGIKGGHPKCSKILQQRRLAGLI